MLYGPGGLDLFIIVILIAQISCGNSLITPLCLFSLNDHFLVQIKTYSVRREIFVISVKCQTSSSNMTSADELRVTTVCFKTYLKNLAKEFLPYFSMNYYCFMRSFIQLCGQTD